MLRVWVDSRSAGILDRFKARGSTFSYQAEASEADAVSVTMPKRTASWNTDFGLAPVFDMNLPEGALRSLLARRFAKAVGTFDDLDLLAVVGRTQIGRLRYAAPEADLDENVPFQSVDEILRARRGGELFDYLLDRFAVHSGLSGVQPKVMIRGDNNESQPAIFKTATHIVKFWNQDEYPELAANEFFCLTVAQKLGMRVPSFHMSDDGGALVVERFDLKPDGSYLGFEDFCVLNGVNTERKYEGGYETRLFKRAREFILGTGQPAALFELFRLFALNCAIRNGDAHLKNFGIIYADVQGQAELAPVYDLVTTQAYMPRDSMALTLNGSTNWPDRRKLTQLGQTRANLTTRQVSTTMEEIADAMSDVAPMARTYFNDRAPELGTRMMRAWEDGIRESLDLAISGTVPATTSAHETDHQRK
jgi:serine/threonine-protein kinase HipA